jgi:hypothetical protein
MKCEGCIKMQKKSSFLVKEGEAVEEVGNEERHAPLLKINKVQ